MNQKIGVLVISLNEVFIPYTKKMLETAKSRLFPGEDVEYMIWSDTTDWPGCTVFEVDAVPWPYPTLMRYHLFLQQEEKLRTFDKLLYIDADMEVMCEINPDILGDGLTCASHPMYRLDRRFIPPYEPNPNSAAYIPRLGQIMTDNKGKLWFEPIYAAGGIQGGNAAKFIEAMWWMKRAIDRDMQNNYIPIWNDESIFNAYLFHHPDDKLIVLDPGYVYPDSLIKEYYIPIWGRDYEKKIVTITKKHTLSKEGGDALKKFIGQPTQSAPATVSPVVCADCRDVLMHPAGLQIHRIIKCNGPMKQHDCELLVLSGTNNTCPTCGDILPIIGVIKVTSCKGIGGLHTYEAGI